MVPSEKRVNSFKTKSYLGMVAEVQAIRMREHKALSLNECSSACCTRLTAYLSSRVVVKSNVEIVVETSAFTGHPSHTTSNDTLKLMLIRSCRMSTHSSFRHALLASDALLSLGDCRSLSFKLCGDLDAVLLSEEVVVNADVSLLTAGGVAFELDVGGVG